MTNPDIDEATAQRKLEALRPVLADLPADGLMTIRLDVVRVVPQILEIAQHAQAERARFAEAFRDFPLERIDRLPDDALALWAAETEYRRLEAETVQRRLCPDEAVVAECRDHRAHLLAAAEYLWRDDEGVKTLLASVRKGTSYVDLADDLSRLSELFGAHWDAVAGRSDVQQDDVAAAARLSTRLMEALGEPEKAELSAWADLRRRAFTHLYRAYERIRAGAAYLHFGDAEALASYPSLYALRGK